MKTMKTVMLIAAALLVGYLVGDAHAARDAEEWEAAANRCVVILERHVARFQAMQVATRRNDELIEAFVTGRANCAVQR